MDGTYKTGDLILTRAQDSYAVGDIVTYKVNGNQQVIHRIIGGDGAKGYTMQGDNNPDPDPWHPTDADVVGKSWHRFEGKAWLMHLPQRPWFVGLAAGLITLLVLGLDSGPRRRPEDAEDRVETDGDDTSEDFLTAVGLAPKVPAQRVDSSSARPEGESAPTRAATGDTGRSAPMSPRRYPAMTRDDAAGWVIGCSPRFVILMPALVTRSASAAQLPVIGRPDPDLERQSGPVPPVGGAARAPAAPPACAESRRRPLPRIDPQGTGQLRRAEPELDPGTGDVALRGRTGALRSGAPTEPRSLGAPRRRPE